MKRIYLLQFFTLLLLSSACSETETFEQPLDVNDTALISTEPCFTTPLIAGQHHDSGVVTLEIDGDNLIVTYSSNGEWTIELTHLALGNCDEDWVPLTNSGSPQIGQFDNPEPYSVTPFEVVYVLSLEEFNLDENFCFAAHAEVNGPTGGETAWAQGTEFDGNSWAMFSEVTECEVDDDVNTPY